MCKVIQNASEHICISSLSLQLYLSVAVINMRGSSSLINSIREARLIYQDHTVKETAFGFKN